MEWDERLRSLERFGFSDGEGRLYLALLERGRATASELAREARLERVLAYRTLDAMRARGVVELTADRPRRYSAVGPGVVFERALRSRRSALTEDTEVAKLLVTELAGLQATRSTSAPRYQILAGTAQVYDYLQEMVDRAQTEIATMLTFQTLRESLGRGIADRLGRFVRGGGRFRLIVEADPRLAPTLVRFRRSFRRFPRAELRLLPTQPVRLTIVDSSEAMLFLVPEAKDRRVDQIAVWTDNPPFIQGQRMFFDAAWATATPAGTKPTATTRRGP